MSIGNSGLGGDADVFVLDNLIVTRSMLNVEIDAINIALSEAEVRLLEMFARRPGAVLPRDDVYGEIFGGRPFPGEGGLRFLVGRLNKKLGPRPDGGERIVRDNDGACAFVPSGNAGDGLVLRKV